MDFSGKTILVVGCGLSGIGAAHLLDRKGARVILFDENGQADRNNIIERLGDTKGVELVLGSLPAGIQEELELVVLSPGVPCDSPFVEGLRSRGLFLIGEIELAWLCGRGQVIAITGTNGKTTTTALCGKIMEEYYDSVFVVGNIGNPYTAEADRMQENSVTVAEISSFQLETVHSFHPRISAILNITEDHLNRHHSMENYVAMKERIAANQKKEDVCVLNYDDKYCRDFALRCPAKVVFFSSSQPLLEGYYLKGEDIWYSEEGRRQKLINIQEIKLLGIHNMENVMAAIAMARAFGVPLENVLKTVRNFLAVEHRIEYVATVDGVEYYNDSKGTNPDAAIKGIQAMNRPTVLIGGGYDKDSEYDGWIESFQGKVSWLILLGQTREKIAACARRKGFSHIVFVDSLEEAVKTAAEKARDGEAVLLSPACASWGMFPNYEVRGKLFKEYVRKLKES